jgi:hypothetical protein
VNRKVGAGDAPIWNAQKKARSMPHFFLRLVARENGVFLQPQRRANRRCAALSRSVRVDLPGWAFPRYSSETFFMMSMHMS